MDKKAHAVLHLGFETDEWEASVETAVSHAFSTIFFVHKADGLDLCDQDCAATDSRPMTRVENDYLCELVATYPRLGRISQ